MQDRHKEIAESIILREGLEFALAAGGGSTEALRKARAKLKTAICKALAGELARGIEFAKSDT